MAVRALGRQWRMDAGLNRDHQLVRTGVYRVVRHPIYASMLCVLVGVGVLVATPPLFIAALIVFLIGTEIRVHVEERLLSARFGSEFDDFKRHVPAYLPPVR
jgi:protein-S-isoprenylcysteine O-methyltransferase Ste14